MLLLSVTVACSFSAKPAALLDLPPVVWPADPSCMQDGYGWRILSGRNDFHPGIDVCPGTGPAPVVVAMADGTVSLVREAGSRGQHIVIRHPQFDGLLGGLAESTVFHLEPGSQLVAAGDLVTTGQPIATMGRSGASTVHAHIALDVGTPEGELPDGVYSYVHPLRVLPYPVADAHMRVIRGRARGTFGKDCSAKHTLDLLIVEPAASMDTVGVTLTPSDADPVHIQLDGPAGWVAGDRDDFTQGCVSVFVADYSPGDSTRSWTARFGGPYASTSSVQVERHRANGGAQIEGLPVD